MYSIMLVGARLRTHWLRFGSAGTLRNMVYL